MSTLIKKALSLTGYTSCRVEKGRVFISYLVYLMQNQETRYKFRQHPNDRVLAVIYSRTFEDELAETIAVLLDDKELANPSEKFLEEVFALADPINEAYAFVELIAYFQFLIGRPGEPGMIRDSDKRETSRYLREKPQTKATLGQLTNSYQDDDELYDLLEQRLEKLQQIIGKHVVTSS